MFARTTGLRFAHPVSDESIPAWASTMRLASQEPGFIEAMLLVEADQQNALSISFWQTQEHSERSGLAGPGTLLDRAVPILRPFLETDPRFTQFAVRRYLG